VIWKHEPKEVSLQTSGRMTMSSYSIVLILIMNMPDKPNSQMIWSSLKNNGRKWRKEEITYQQANIIGYKRRIATPLQDVRMYTLVKPSWVCWRGSSDLKSVFWKRFFFGYESRESRVHLMKAEDLIASLLGFSRKIKRSGIYPRPRGMEKCRHNALARSKVVPPRNIKSHAVGGGESSHR